jgi:hypothetical protein
MQYRQPMQSAASTRTMPFFVENVADVGHTFMQGASSQCWHERGTQCMDRRPCSLRSGRSRCSPAVRMRFHHMPSGTSFSDLQITAHDQQPMHRSVSTAMP